jgi:maleate cis-trans isomerase
LNRQGSLVRQDGSSDADPIVDALKDGRQRWNCVTDARPSECSELASLTTKDKKRVKYMLDQWKARIGWITPRVNSDTEIYDFYQVAPKDVVLVVNSLAVIDSARKEEIENSIRLIEQRVEHLNLSGVDHIMQKGAPVHLHFGNEGHNKILERMRAISKVPVSTSSKALADAFNALGAKKILVISSWRDESPHLAANLRNHLSSEGIEVAAVEGIGQQLKSFEKGQLTPTVIFSNVASQARKHPEVDAVYIQSGTMTSIPIIDALEQSIGKPVVSTNSASIWGSFHALGIRVNPGFGKLLSSI